MNLILRLFQTSSSKIQPSPLKHGAHRSGYLKLSAIMTCSLAMGCNMASQITLPLHSKAIEPVQQIVAMWQLSERDNQDGTRQTGFTGQLLFLGSDDPVPQQVSSNVMVLIYERENDTWALRRQFKCTPDAWASHERRTAVGTVYNVFVPHDIDARAHQHYALRVQHVAENGQKRVSELITL